jgi:hypothetical protein
MQRRHLLATSAALAFGGLLTTTADAAKPPKRRKSTGLFVNQVRGAAGALPSGGIEPTLDGTFRGNVLIKQFKFVEGKGLLVSGIISGNARSSSGRPLGHVTNQTFTDVPATLTGGSAAKEITAQAVACQVLNLDIGRITLNLLGLVIDLAPISLDITAIPGGGLLGDLLCALANLLNPLGPLGEILGILTQINDLLQTLRIVLGGVG